MIKMDIEINDRVRIMIPNEVPTIFRFLCENGVTKEFNTIKFPLIYVSYDHNKSPILTFSSRP